MNRKLKDFSPFLFSLGFLFISRALVAKDGDLQRTLPPAGPLSLNQAVEYALANYPAVQAVLARADAAAAGVDLARTAYLPRTDLLWQENRASRNNIFGQLLPQSVIPSLTGPVLGTTSFASAWGSAGGMLFSWEIFDFGLRKANVDQARAAKNQADAGAEATRLDVATAAADAFLAVLATQQSLHAAQANVERLRVFAESVHVLVNNQLRPGAEASRADAELAGAKIQLIQTQQNAEISQAALAEALGMAGSTVQIDPGPLLQLPSETAVANTNLESHPLLVAQQAALEAVRANERALDRAYYPRFNFQSTITGRGSGALPDGRLDGSKGLLPEVPNWAVGMSVTFPVFDLFGLKARRRIESSNEAAERARYEELLQRLRGQDARVRAVYQAARGIAENTPVQLNAAQETETRARARYEAGLTSITEVAEAQRLRAQAETDDGVARLGVWRALLARARVRGDVKPFLQQVLATPVSGRK